MTVEYPRYRCETGACVRAESDGASTVIWETAQPDIRVVTSTASWQALLDEVRDKERKRIVAGLRHHVHDVERSILSGRSVPSGGYGHTVLDIAWMIERGEFDDVAASND
jgi:hypothetical protein